MRGWLVCEARFIDDPNVVTQSFAERVLDAGVPLDCLATAMPTLDAVRQGVARRWERGAISASPVTRGCPEADRWP